MILPLLLVATAGTATAAGPPVAADVTERGRGLSYAIDRLLVPRREAAGEERTVWLLIDVTSSLRRSPFADLLADSIARNARKLVKTRIGVGVVGADGGAALAPTAEHARVAPEVRTLLTRPAKTFQNVYAAVRRYATAPSVGTREIVLVTLENGDAVEDLGAVVATLKRTGTRLGAIAREAFLSDSYWVTHETQAPRRFTMIGGDTAFIELPWGWLFQQGIQNEVVPSGFAMYGITRMAAASGGKVFLYYPPTNTTTPCAYRGFCPFCSNDQIGAHEFYETHRLRTLSPLAGSKAEVFGQAGRDPYFKAALRTWARASKEGLTISRPSVKPAGSSLRREKRQRGNPTTFGRSLGFSSQAMKAEKLAATAGRFAADLAAEVEEIGSGVPRYRAVAEYTVLMLRLTRLNLLYYAAFCREVAPKYGAMASDPPTPPQRWIYGPRQMPTGIMWSSMTLSHGVPPFYELRLPGDEKTDRELRAFAPRFHAFIARYGRTPFAEAARQAGIARFVVSFRGKSAPPPTRVPRSSEKKETTTETERPQRGGGGSGSGGGATSGGK